MATEKRAASKKNVHLLQITNFPDNVRESAKIEAIKKGVSLREFVIETIRKEVKK